MPGRLQAQALMQPGIVARIVAPLEGLRVAELREALSALAFVLILRESRILVRRRAAGVPAPGDRSGQRRVPV